VKSGVRRGDIFLTTKLWVSDASYEKAELPAHRGSGVERADDRTDARRCVASRCCEQLATASEAVSVLVEAVALAMKGAPSRASIFMSLNTHLRAHGMRRKTTWLVAPPSC
jgi:hypothetical protein